MSDNCLVKCMIIIVDRGKSENIIKFLRDKNIMCNFVMQGHGTAAAQWQNLLGIGDIKKDVIVSVLDKDRVTEILDGLGSGFGMRGPGHGVAFTISVNSIGGKRLLNYCLGKVED